MSMGAIKPSSPMPPKKRMSSAAMNSPSSSSKPKQMKSRNGCVTCKAKRMKCDETRPTCLQCARRRKVCGGYRTGVVGWKQFIDPKTGSKPMINNGIILLEPRGDEPKPNASSVHILDLISLPDLPEPEPTAAVTSTGDEADDVEEVTMDSLIDPNLDLLVDLRRETNFEKSGCTNALMLPSIDDPGQLEVWDNISTLRSSTPANSDVFPLYHQPIFDIGGTNMLTTLFQSRTCGILSLKDGPETNPWITLIWPLARQAPALDHAIAAMTCLHLSTAQPELHAQGLKHLRKSIEHARRGVRSGQLSQDAAVASMLALSLGQSWEYPRTATGTKHLKQATMLLKKALSNSSQIAPEQKKRLSFLANTWLYVDVMTRLTALDLNENIDLNLISAFESLQDDANKPFIDPLMGCAASLFPLIGRAGDLARRVYENNFKRKSPALVSEATEIMRAVEAWQPEPSSRQIEEEPSVVADSIQTAEAFRWATILLLRQALPALPSFEPLAETAQKILVYLATTPPSSTAITIQMFPLLIAGCEVDDVEERQWVRERWKRTEQRCITGIVDRCLELTEEIWRRRDEQSGRRSSSLGLLDEVRTPLFDDTLMGMVCHQNKGFDSGLQDQTSDGFFDDVSGSATTSTAMQDPPLAWKPSAVMNTSRKLAKPCGTVIGGSVITGLAWLRVMHDWKWQVMLG